MKTYIVTLVTTERVTVEADDRVDALSEAQPYGKFGEYIPSHTVSEALTVEETP